MPEAIIKAELYPLFGGYWGYRAAPSHEVQEQRLVIIARKNVEARLQAEQNADIKARQEALERKTGIRA